MNGIFLSTDALYAQLNKTIFFRQCETSSVLL